MNEDDTSREVALIRAFIAASVLLLSACGDEAGPTAGQQRDADCFRHEASGTYEIDRHFEIEDEATMQQLAAECEIAGCIKRETAICLFEEARAEWGFAAATPGANVVRVHANDDPPFLAWDVWIPLSGEDRDTGYTEFGCRIEGLGGEEKRCSGRAPVIF